MTAEKHRIVMIVKNEMVPHDLNAYIETGADFVNIPCETEDEIIEAARDAEYLVTMLKPVTRKVIETLDNCKMIYNLGTGFEAIDLEAATDKGICVSFPGGYCSLEVAEHTMGLIIGCARKICRLDRAVRAGKWDSYEKKEIRTQILPPMFQLKGKTVGLVGFGRIAQNIVPLAKAFNMKVVAYDPYVPSEVFETCGAESVSLNFLIENSDFISLHAAFTDDAKHMISDAQLKKMKHSAFLLNCARGAFVDEDALYRAIKEGQIAGAALDVMATETVLPDNPLLELESVIVTPHSAYYSMESREKFAVRPFEDIAMMINGSWPKCLINTEVKDAYVKKWGGMKDA